MNSGGATSDRTDGKYMCSFMTYIKLPFNTFELSDKTRRPDKDLEKWVAHLVESAAHVCI